MIPARITSLDDPAFGALFTEIRASWRRLETFDAYTVAYEQPDLERYLATGHIDTAFGDWENMIAAHKDAGRTMQRVHVITMPPSDYIRFELASYEVTASAGEQIRLIPVAPGQWPAGVARRDYWIFDDHDVWYMAYDRAGRFRYAQRCNWAYRWAKRSWDAAWAQSVPLTDVTAPLLHA